ncbi:MAG: AmmeMemoRadiSam system protein A [Acidobacteria bacterium]|nr:AmmeMemoRadiSam system protein A [Acidobacteriota bacterium]
MPGPEERGPLLVTLARRAIEHEIGRGTVSKPFGVPWLDELAATFVTLEQHGDLRGCVGSIDPVRQLFDDVTSNARSAAFRDPRFHPLSEDELGTIEIEVSVLSPVTPVRVESETELLRMLEPGVHGLILRLGQRRATFLPSVWEKLATPREFVRSLKRKAGIPPAHWSDEIEVLVYTVEKFGR